MNLGIAVVIAAGTAVVVAIVLGIGTKRAKEGRRDTSAGGGGPELSGGAGSLNGKHGSCSQDGDSSGDGGGDGGGD